MMSDLSHVEVVNNMAANRRNFADRININQFTDEELLARYRLDRNGIMYVCNLMRNDIESPTARNHALSAEVKTLITLRFLATGKFQLCNGDNTGVAQSTVSRVVEECLNSLSSPRMVGRFISFPITLADVRQQQHAFYQICHFPGVIGVIDGTHIQIIAPSINEPAYVNRHHYHSINTQVVFDSKDKIVDVVARWPGSTHDSRILNNSGLFTLFENNHVPNGCHLLGDSGYACRRWLLTPYLNPAPGSQTRYNRAHKVTRAAVERGIGQWKRRFGVLHGEIRMKPDKVCKVITACAILHNICKERNIPMPQGNPNPQFHMGQIAPQVRQQPNNITGLRYRDQFALTHFPYDVSGLSGLAMVKEVMVAVSHGATRLRVAWTWTVSSLSKRRGDTGSSIMV